MGRHKLTGGEAPRLIASQASPTRSCATRSVAGMSDAYCEFVLIVIHCLKAVAINKYSSSSRTIALVLNIKHYTLHIKHYTSYTEFNHQRNQQLTSCFSPFTFYPTKKGACAKMKIIFKPSLALACALAFSY
jgi:hypothetical protein